MGAFSALSFWAWVRAVEHCSAVKLPDAVQSASEVKLEASTVRPELAAGGSPHWVAGGALSQAEIEMAEPAIRLVRVTAPERLRRRGSDMGDSGGHAGGVEHAHRQGDAGQIDPCGHLAALDAGGDILHHDHPDEGEGGDLDDAGQGRPG